MQLPILWSKAPAIAPEAPSPGGRVGAAEPPPNPLSHKMGTLRAQGPKIWPSAPKGAPVSFVLYMQLASLDVIFVIER